MNKKKLWIIIPAHNEEKRIEHTLREYSYFWDRVVEEGKGSVDYKILVIINNSQDKTLEIVDKWAKKNSRIDYRDIKPGGKGFAIKEGFRLSLALETRERDSYIGFVDADCATGPEEFYRLYRKLDYVSKKGYQYKGNVDKRKWNGGVIASRYMKGSVVQPKQSLVRIICSRIFNGWINGLMWLGIRDTQCGAKIFTAEAIKNIVEDLGITKWAFDVDLIHNLKKKGYYVLEIPTVWADKEYSKINFMEAGPKMALAVLRLRLLNSPLRFFIDFYDFIRLR